MANLKVANGRPIASAAKEKGRTASLTKDLTTMDTAPQLWKRKFRVPNRQFRNSRCTPRRKRAPKTWDIMCESTSRQTKISKVTSAASEGTLNRNWSAPWHATTTDERKPIGSNWRRSNRNWTFPEKRKRTILLWLRTDQAKKELTALITALIMWLL